LGDFVLPSFIEEAQDEALINLALTTRPEIVAARAASKGTQSAILLAKGDKIPTLLVGPEYTKDEFHHFAGFIAAVPLPILNSGAPLVRQREAEHRRALTAVEQLEQRTTTQIKVATTKWNSANRLVNQIEKSTTNLKASVARLEKLFEANQTDISRLLQARQRLIQLENSRLDAIWQATQAQSDLMLAVGAPSVIGTLPAGS
jgi:cobalt-zinc-cadmium efflux system outer membrane protein